MVLTGGMWLSSSPIWSPWSSWLILGVLALLIVGFSSGGNMCRLVLRGDSLSLVTETVGNVCSISTKCQRFPQSITKSRWTVKKIRRMDSSTRRRLFHFVHLEHFSLRSRRSQFRMTSRLERSWLGWNSSNAASQQTRKRHEYIWKHCVALVFMHGCIGLSGTVSAVPRTGELFMRWFRYVEGKLRESIVLLGTAKLCQAWRYLKIPCCVSPRTHSAQGNKHYETGY